MKTIVRTIACCLVAFSATTCWGVAEYTPANAQVSLALKVPGNPAVDHLLQPTPSADSHFDYEYRATTKLPVTVFQKIEGVGGNQKLTVVLTALQDVYFNYSQQVKTDFRHADCQFYLPDRKSVV